MAQDPRALLQKAEKATSAAGGGFAFFGGRQDKWENAADLYTQAANAFRMQKQGTFELSYPSPFSRDLPGKEAGQAFERAATIQSKNLSEPDDAANSLIEAFKAYRKSDPEDAVRVAGQAIAHYTSKGNFRRAAQNQQTLAEVLEIEIGDNKRALEAYEVAAGWFEGDGAEALANKDYLKVADLAGLEADYYRAIDNYMRVAKSAVNNNLMRFSVKDYFLKAGICHLASGDMVATSQALEQFRTMDPSFANTREWALLSDLKEAVESGEQEQYLDKLYQFDQMSPLDKWKTTLLLRVKNAIEEKDEDFS